MKGFGKYFIVIVFLFSVCSSFCQAKFSKQIITGAEQINTYLPLLNNKKVALVANKSSVVGGKHLADTLLHLGIKITKVFCPEHGFRGTNGAGAHVDNSIDTITGLPIISLYGKTKKPLAGDMLNIDIMIFDIQDVGVRFYTYISTLHYIMEACAENHIALIVLDRPNPNGYFIDGPVLDTGARSFVGMHHVPLVYGMTIGEYALMINGEHWLADNEVCSLSVIPCKNYDHNTLYELPIKPSPNLPNIRAVLLYPSLGLFEGTIVSVGRGTDFPFQVYGHPNFRKGDIEFTPESNQGATNPKLKGELCTGFDLQQLPIDVITTSKQINLQYLLMAYKELKRKTDFFNVYFYRLAGTNMLQKQIEEGLSGDEIRASWQNDLEKFKKTRKNYLLYSDFND